MVAPQASLPQCGSAASARVRQVCRGRPARCLTRIKLARANCGLMCSMLRSTPRVLIAYAPRGNGLRCALAYLADTRDVFGWFTGPDVSGGLVALYFVLEGFYSNQEPRYAAARGLDLHTGWLLDQQRCHELAALQEAFAAEWLFYRFDPAAQTELAAYSRAELAIGEPNIRFERLNKLSRLQPTWTFYSTGFEHGVLRRLAKRWPLDYRSDEEPQVA